MPKTELNTQTLAQAPGGIQPVFLVFNSTLLKKWPASLGKVGKLWKRFQACYTTFLDKCGKPHILVIYSIYVNYWYRFLLNLRFHPLLNLIELEILTIYIHPTRKLPHSSERLRRHFANWESRSSKVLVLLLRNLTFWIKAQNGFSKFQKGRWPSVTFGES